MSSNIPGCELLTVNPTLELVTFNLPPGRCCPGRSVWCWDEGNGYCQKFHWKCSADRLAWRLEQTRRDDFEQRMVNELLIAESYRYPACRIHSAGDFYSAWYLRKWVAINRALRLAGSSIRLFAYSKNWRIDTLWQLRLRIATAAGLPIWLSADPSTSDPRLSWNPDKRYIHCAYVEGAPGAGPVSCSKQLEHGMSCARCGLCFDPAKMPSSITFRKH